VCTKQVTCDTANYGIEWHPFNNPNTQLGVCVVWKCNGAVDDPTKCFSGDSAGCKFKEKFKADCPVMCLTCVPPLTTSTATVTPIGPITPITLITPTTVSTTFNTNTSGGDASGSTDSGGGGGMIVRRVVAGLLVLVGIVVLVVFLRRERTEAAHATTRAENRAPPPSYGVPPNPHAPPKPARSTSRSGSNSDQVLYTDVVPVVNGDEPARPEAAVMYAALEHQEGVLYTDVNGDAANNGGAPNSAPVMYAVLDQNSAAHAGNHAKAGAGVDATSNVRINVYEGNPGQPNQPAGAGGSVLTYDAILPLVIPGSTSSVNGQARPSSVYAGFDEPSSPMPHDGNAMVMRSVSDDVGSPDSVTTTVATTTPVFTAKKCLRPSPTGGTCKNTAEAGSAFCKGHTCPVCGATKSSGAPGCIAHGGNVTEA
jgi:hypothetical protein